MLKITVAFLLILLPFFNYVIAQSKDTNNQITEISGKDTAIYHLTTKYIDGTKLTLQKCDGVVYKKVGSSFYVRRIEKYIYSKWFTAKKEIKDPLNQAIKLANAFAVPLYISSNSSIENIESYPSKGFMGSGIIKYRGTHIFKPGLQFIGIPQNISEKKYLYPNLIKEGKLKAAPLSTKSTAGSFKILAHWYNDFGLKRTALAKNQSRGSYVWYDWRWNFTSNANYDPSRHPLLGWYRGDDPMVLDWISYWLVKYKVDGVILSNTFSTVNWQKPESKAHWLYQLFNHSKNFKNLNYSVWISANHGVSVEAAQKTDSDMINNVVAKYKNVNCFVKEGKRYPIFYAWDMEGFRGTYDKYNGYNNSIKRLTVLASMCRKLGYDGICIYGRNLAGKWNSFSTSKLSELSAAGVYMFSQNYSTTYAKSNSVAYKNQYAKYAEKVEFPNNDNVVLNVMTAASSQKPHPSKWKLAGSTPALFKKVLQRAIRNVAETGKDKTIVIYNVSEWAEGGPGLIPNQRDFFGYLEAISASK